MWADAGSWICLIVVGVIAALSERCRTKRYGGYTDPIKVRVRFGTYGIRRKRLEDGLYDKDGRINRNWKP